MLQMHLMQKCIFATRTFSKGKCSANQNVRKRQNAFDAKMHFGVHFPKENVQRTFYFVKCSASHFPL